MNSLCRLVRLTLQEVLVEPEVVDADVVALALAELVSLTFCFGKISSQLSGAKLTASLVLKPALKPVW